MDLATRLTANAKSDLVVTIGTIRQSTASRNGTEEDNS